jgi:hypothetical protein
MRFRSSLKARSELKKAGVLVLEEFDKKQRFCGAFETTRLAP